VIERERERERERGGERERGRERERERERNLFIACRKTPTIFLYRAAGLFL